MSPADWSWNGEALVALGLAAGYVVGTRDARNGWRAASFLSGCALLLVALVTPLDTLARGYLVWGHLLQNVVLAEWAPLLVVLGIPPALAVALTRSPVARALTHPAVALPLWLANYMLWHHPWIYDAALERPGSLLHLEHACYFATGVLMWWSVVQDAPHRLGPGTRAGYTFAAFVLGSPIGLVMALVPDAIYDFYVAAHHRVWGLTPLGDQQLGGILMALEQAVVFFAVFAYWFLRFLVEEDRRADLDAPPELRVP